MNNKIILITPPDDSVIEGIRIIAFNLSVEQTQFVSNVLNSLESFPNIVIYLTKSLDSHYFLLQKPKCDIIIFNADTDDDMMNGFLAAQKNSCYFGNLKKLNKVNENAIYNEEQLLNILEESIKKYEK